ncbi:MAG: AMP-binding protein, partial [Magnetococcales bacterium]|nr:AMP-binding protein [Magnetococcales bacterium]
IYRNPSVLHFDNLYGPSEDTTYSTCARIPRDLLGAPSIGRPLANTQAYILDRHLEPVPVGVVGELHLSGDGLARCYLNRPELTAEKFIANPFRTGTTSRPCRMYKTGDLARFRPDGSIDFLGRRDHQVKVRGFRIELGEIENALNQHEHILESVVLVRADANDNRHLVAYVVPGTEPGPGVGELRSYLKMRVPEYMIPALFVLMPQGLPLTTNGKLDRKALPDPERSRTGLETQLAAPTTPVERILVELWREVLGLDTVGIHDNFFDLGGDSILSIQIVARARQSGLVLTLKQMFQQQTIAELALVAEHAAVVLADQGIVTGPLPLTAIQSWFLARNTVAPHHFNQAHLLVTPPDLQPAWVEKSLRRMIEWHDALRLRFYRQEVSVDHPTGWRQEMVVPDGTLPFEVEDLSALAPEQWLEVVAARAEERQASLDLTRGPLLRVVYFKGPARQPGRLLFVIHHLVVDGVSWRILFEDLERGYAQASRGEAIVFPAKTTSFQQWARSITASSQADLLVAEIPYWQGELSKPRASLPLDWPENLVGNTVASAARIRLSLDEKQTTALLREAPGAYNTHINDLLLTALARALSQGSPEGKPILVDLEGHGREALSDPVDVTRTVGWFTSLFPVYLDPGAADGWPGQAIKRIKESMRAIPRHGMGYGLLRHVLCDPATRMPLITAPEAEVSFNYFGQYDPMLGGSHLFALASEATGTAIAPEAPRSHIVEINGFVTQGRMQWEWTYSTALHRRETVERLARHFLIALQQLIEHCLAPDVGGFTPTDFPEARLNQDDLDALLEELA